MRRRHSLSGDCESAGGKSNRALDRIDLERYCEPSRLERVNRRRNANRIDRDADEHRLVVRVSEAKIAVAELNGGVSPEFEVARIAVRIDAVAPVLDNFQAAQQRRVVERRGQQADRPPDFLDQFACLERGGSVHAQVCYAETPLSSPIIDEGCADLLIALEPLERRR